MSIALQVGLILLAVGLIWEFRQMLYKLNKPVWQPTLPILLWPIAVAAVRYVVPEWLTEDGLWVPLLVFIPVFIGFVLTFSPSGMNWLRELPPAWLVRTQRFRAVLALLLWLGCLQQLVPPQLTFLWLNFDIIIGLTAIPAAWVFFRQGYTQPVAIGTWNFFGILMVVGSVFITALSLPGDDRVFYNTPDATFFLNVPGIIWLTFFLPYSILLHLWSLRQLQLRSKGRRKFTLRRK